MNLKIASFFGGLVLFVAVGLQAQVATSNLECVASQGDRSSFSHMDSGLVNQSPEVSVSQESGFSYVAVRESLKMDSVHPMLVSSTDDSSLVMEVPSVSSFSLSSSDVRVTSHLPEQGYWVSQGQAAIEEESNKKHKRGASLKFA